MRPQPDLPRPPARASRRTAGRGRSVVIALLVVLVVLLISLRGIAAFYTDYLWFDSLGLGGLWRRVIVTKAGLTFLGGVVFFILCWVNLLIAERLAPVFRPSNGEEDLIERYHEAIGRRAWLVRVLVALFLALVIGVSLGAAWTEWVLFTNAVSWNSKDATFNTDIGFYVFRLPFLTSALSWLFSSLVVIFVVTVLAHIVNGGIRFHNQLDRVTPQVKAHLSVLLAVLALVQASRYWLDHYALTFSTRGTVDGATYTDVNVTQRAYYLLMLIALFAVGLFIANIWRRGWILPVMAVGLWVLVALIAQGIIPAVVQRVRVEPTESSREREYIANNIEATRIAYGLDVEGDEEVTDWTDPLSAEDLQANTPTMDNVRLWDPSLIGQSFAAEETLQPYFQVGDVDVDRYEVDGEIRQVMLAARDANPAGANQSSWESTHLVYTNGYGVVAAAGNDKTSGGDPVLLASGIPVDTDGLPDVSEPRIFFGEDSGGYVIVNTDVKVPADELATAGGIFDPYEGQDGIEIGSGVAGFVNKAAFSLRFGDIDPLLSGSIKPDSKVLMGRDVNDRVKALAPFLAFDHDPYLVLTPDGRLQYVVDGYTTTRNYPNAQQADTGGLPDDSGLRGRSFNYVRNSVKAVVDAYDGTVTMYVVDDEDPLIQAYAKAFPDLFTPGSEMDESLKEHLRYPEDLFTVQSQMWTRYHVEDPDDFYKEIDAWAVPAAVGSVRQTGKQVVEVGPDGRELTDGDRYPSQYVYLQLPGDDDASFVLLRPFVTASDSATSGGQNQLRALLTGAVDENGRTTLRQFRYDRKDAPDGPNLAAEDIQGNAQVSEVVRDLCTNVTTNTCTFTSPTIVPVADALLYVQSLAVAGKEQQAPRIKYVIVNYVAAEDPRIEIATSLRGALVQLFGSDVPTSIEDAGSTPITDPTDPTEPTDPGETPSTGEQPSTGTEREDELIDGIVQAFADAEEAAAEGDLVGQATELEKASELAAQLQELRRQQRSEVIEDGETPTTTEPSTTTTTEPSGTTTTTTAGA